MGDASIFSPKVLIGWAAAACGLFALTFWMIAAGVGGGGGREAAIGPSSYSKSAIGYAALAEFLRRSGLNVVKDRKTDDRSMSNDLVVITGGPDSAAYEAQRARLTAAPNTLYVLPKWYGYRDRDHDGWIGEPSPLPRAAAENFLAFLGQDGTIVRGANLGPVTRNDLAPLVPSVDGGIQLIKGGTLMPVVATAEGILIGRAGLGDGRMLWVVADPDLLSNFGLHKEDNAALALALIRRANPFGGAVVFDETVHGFRTASASGGALKLFVSWPYVLATLNGVAAIALLVWATLGRFGPPRPPEPRALDGKLALVGNAARLIEHAGHHDVMARRYVETIVHYVGRRLRAPSGLAFPALVDWLDRAATARGVSIDTKAAVYGALGEASGRRSRFQGYVAAIRTLHAWKGELIDGSRGASHGR